MYRPSNTVLAVLAIVSAAGLYLWRLLRWYRLEQFKAYRRVPPDPFWGHLKAIGEAMKELPKGANSGMCFPSYNHLEASCCAKRVQTMLGNLFATNTIRKRHGYNSICDPLLECQLMSSVLTPWPSNVRSRRSHSSTRCQSHTRPRTSRRWSVLDL